MLLASFISVHELAGLGTAFLWACSSLAWSLAGRRVGSVQVAAVRILLATLILGGIHWAIYGSPWPSGIGGQSLLLLIASGVVGACIADMLLFQGLILIGPRLGTLLLSLSPIFTVLIGYVGPMHEALDLQAIGGIILTITGVAWTVSQPRGPGGWPTHAAHFKAGVVMCILAAITAAAGFVLSRMGMQAYDGQAGVDPFHATVVRVASATAAIWLLLPIMSKTRLTLAAFAKGRVMLIILAGTIVGPVLGIWLSMIALKGVSSGIAAAMISTSPIMMIPIAYFAYGDKPTWRATMGTVLAVAGVFLLLIHQ